MFPGAVRDVQVSRADLMQRMTNTQVASSNCVSTSSLSLASTLILCSLCSTNPPSCGSLGLCLRNRRRQEVSEPSLHRSALRPTASASNFLSNLRRAFSHVRVSSHFTRASVLLKMKAFFRAMCSQMSSDHFSLLSATRIVLCERCLSHLLPALLP